MSVQGENTDKLQQLKQHNVWDVVIVGSGPASCSAAIVLAEKGWSVLVLEQYTKNKNRFGESLPPASVSLVHQLLGGISEGEYARFGIKSTPGNQSSWADTQLDIYDFMSQPGGHGMCVNRHQFDEALKHRAKKKGASFINGCRFASCERISEHPTVYRLNAELTDNQSNSQSVELQSRFIIDASGRFAAVGKSIGLTICRHDKLQAFIKYYFAPTPIEAPDFTLLEATRDGWWYSNLLPDRQTRVVVFHTDRDLPQAREARSSEGFEHLLSDTQHVSQKIITMGYRPSGNIKVTAANSQVASEFVQGQILLLGDAAMAFDPLSSQGMMKALQNGNKAGQLIAFTLEDLQTSKDQHITSYLNRFEQSQQQLWQQYQQQYQYYYAAQQRWKNSEFWLRRRTAFGRTEQHERIAL